MADSFYPFVGESDKVAGKLEMVEYPARIAVVDDVAAAPRVVVVQPTDVRSYLEEVTATVTKLAAEQGGGIPFTVIREVVENLVHAYFREPTVSILDGGNTIRFSDQGPGIREKEKALQYGTTSATESMKRYIRGVGSGLPYAQQWMRDHGGDLTIEDNISAGTVVTISLAKAEQAVPSQATTETLPGEMPQQAAAMPLPYGMPAQQYPAQTFMPQSYPAPQGYAMPQYPQATPYVAPMQGFTQYPPQYPQINPYAQGVMQQPVPQQPAARADVTVSERGRLALAYLMQHESVGPTELVSLHGSSMSTWTRELKHLEQQGLIHQQGQKRFLTPAGRHFAMMQ